MGGLPVELAAFTKALDQSVNDRVAKMDMESLNKAHALLEARRPPHAPLLCSTRSCSRHPRIALQATLTLAPVPISFEQTLCQQYMRDAVKDLSLEDCPHWFHKCVYNWCIDEGKLFDERHKREVEVTPKDVLDASPALYPEHDLAAAIGPVLRQALTSEVRYQELLFPGGSFHLVFPWYNEAVLCDFNNETIVQAVKYINQKSEQFKTNVTVLEIGAGTGGTASQVLPLINGHCEKYIFTDVSEQFLRQARKKFSGDYPFVEYTLCNIDADPRLQGFALHQVDIIIATNVLHATPFIKNTLANCRKLLKSGGLIFANESLHTTAFLNITFGLTDGWWLFHEVCACTRGYA